MRIKRTVEQTQTNPRQSDRNGSTEKLDDSRAQRQSKDQSPPLLPPSLPPTAFLPLPLGSAPGSSMPPPFRTAEIDSRDGCPSSPEQPPATRAKLTSKPAPTEVAINR